MGGSTELLIYTSAVPLRQNSILPAMQPTTLATPDKTSRPTATITSRSFYQPSLVVIWLFAVVMWCGLPFSPNTVDSDFWGHVRYGTDALTHGLDRTATYTYTAEGHRWINHENLAEILFAVVTQYCGVRGLLILKLMMGLAVLYPILRLTRNRRVDTATATVACILLAVNLSFYWGLRPHLFSFFFFAVMIFWIDTCMSGWHRSPADNSAPLSPRWRLSRCTVDSSFDQRRLRALWCCPALLMIWTNTHGGFLAGVAVYAVLMAGRALEAWLSDHPQRRRLAIHLAGLAAAGCAVTLVNPYGMELQRWLLRALGTPRPEIQEWHPIDWWSPSSAKLWMVLAFAAAGLIAHRKRLDGVQVTTLCFVFFQAVRHQRHWPFFAILTIYWLTPAVSSLVTRWANAWVPRAALSFGQRPRIIVAVLLLGLAFRFGALTASRLQGVPVPRDEYPVSAVQYMADHELRGKLIVSGHWAQYLLAVYGARESDDQGIRVAFDGRFRTCYPQQVVDLHFDLFQGDGGPEERYRSPLSPPVDPGRILSVNDPDFALVNRCQSLAIEQLASRPDEWELCYQDSLAQLWRRRSSDRPPHVAFTAPRQISNAPQVGDVAWPAAPRRTVRNAPESADPRNTTQLTTTQTRELNP